MKFEKYITKAGQTKWKFYHYFGVNPDTGEVDEVKRQGFKTQGEAREVLKQIILDYEDEQIVNKARNSEYRFEEVTELWLMQYEKQVAVTTYTDTKRLIRVHIAPYFKKIYINKITVRLCQEVTNHWYSTYSEAALLVSITNRIIKFGINQEFCKDNPMEKVIRPKNTHKKPYKPPFFEKDELLIFLKAVEENESLKAYTMFHTLAFTGLRRGELFSLQWRDIDFDRKTLSVNRNLIYNEIEKRFEYTTPKTKSSKREIGIDNHTIQVLLKWRNYQREFFLGRGININNPTQLIFTSVNNHYMSDSYLRRIIKRVTINNDLPHITVHGFRHTHCSLLFEAGIEMNQVKDRLGHSDIQTTMNIYAHVTKMVRSKTADLFSDFMSESSL